MQWASWQAFWDMGGYGLYVWGSYAALVIGLIGEIVLLRKGRRATLARLKRMQAWEDQST